MSAHVTGLIWARLNVSGGTLLTALALGDCARHDGTHIYPSVRLVAQMTRQSERQVRRQLGWLRGTTWLLLVQAGGIRGGRRQPSSYRINPLWMSGAVLSGVPECTPDILSGVEPTPDTTGTRPLTNAASTPDTAVSANPGGSIMDPLSAGTRASPPGARPAPEGTLEQRIASARDFLSLLPKTPRARIASMYQLTADELEQVFGPVATYSGAG